MWDEEDPTPESNDSDGDGDTNTHSDDWGDTEDEDSLEDDCS